MNQFISHREGNKDMVEELPEDFPAINQNEIMERPSVSNDDAAHLFGDAAKAFEI